MFIQSYLHSAVEIIKVYTGAEPFSSFLKKYFNQYKKFGSRDRKHITHLCYCYFRLGKALRNVESKERMLIAFFLCSFEDSPILNALKPDWNEKVNESFTGKINLLQQVYIFQEDDILSISDDISVQINYAAFIASFFTQPDLFLRIRPGFHSQVEKKLSAAGIIFNKLSADCISLLPTTKVDDVLQLNKEVVVQDRSSQKVLDLVEPFLKTFTRKLSVWDCCAASGGKSLLLHDIYPNIQLTVSDIRNSILINLKKRFQQAGLRQYHSFVADVSAPDFYLPQQFDVIICDVPCTGSGTWSRTPEQLYFFNKEKINTYASLQKRIVYNASKSLHTGGLLVYITCSVFTKENEEVVDFIQKNAGLTLHKMCYFKGYHQRADTLFAALFIRS